jgi:Hexokinase
VGKDVVEILQAEIDKRKLPVHVSAFVNDTVGTLMARSYASPSEEGSLIGAIFGTGTNGAYVEKIENIPKLRHIQGLKSMVVNLEWAAFDNKVNPMNQQLIAAQRHAKHAIRRRGRQTQHQPGPTNVRETRVRDVSKRNLSSRSPNFDHICKSIQWEIIPYSRQTIWN